MMRHDSIDYSYNYLPSHSAKLQYQTPSCPHFSRKQKNQNKCRLKIPQATIQGQTNNENSIIPPTFSLNRVKLRSERFHPPSYPASETGVGALRDGVGIKIPGGTVSPARGQFSGGCRDKQAQSRFVSTERGTVDGILTKVGFGNRKRRGNYNLI